YAVDVNFFKWLLGSTSNNLRHLRDSLRGVQKAAIQITIEAPEGNDSTTETDSALNSAPSKIEKGRAVKKSHRDFDRWASIPLLGPVGVGRGMVHFEVHSSLVRH